MLRKDLQVIHATYRQKNGVIIRRKSDCRGLMDL